MNPDSSVWTLIAARNDDGRISIRRCDFPNDLPGSQFSHRLNVFWQMKKSSPNGMPTDAESDRLQVFENRLVEATEADDQAVLSLVVTGKNQREYVFHTRSVDKFLRRLMNMPQETERYPIEIHHTEDSTWEYVDRVLSDIKLADAWP